MLTAVWGNERGLGRTALQSRAVLAMNIILDGSLASAEPQFPHQERGPGDSNGIRRDKVSQVPSSPRLPLSPPSCPPVHVPHTWEPFYGVEMDSP